MKWFARLVFALFLAVLAPGLYAWIGSQAWPLYFPLLRLHVYAGIVLAFLAAPSLAVHLRRTGSRPAPTLLWSAGILIVIGLVLLRLPFFEETLPLARAAGTGAAQLLATALFCALLPRLNKPVPTRVSGVLLTVATLLATHLGLVGWSVRGDERWGALLAHSGVGVASAFLILPHLRAFRARIFGPAQLRGRPPALTRGQWGVVALLGSVVGGGVALGWAQLYRWEHFSGFDLDQMTRRWRIAASPARADQRPDPSPHVLSEAALSGSLSCGQSGCHEALTEQWRGSAHRFAADNDFYLAVVDRLVAERGVAEAAFCANCHDPVRVFAGTVERDYATGRPPPGEGVNCVGCHGIVQIPREPANGIHLLREPRPLPEPAQNIHYDPRFHRQQFVTRDLTTSGNMCGTCHRVVLSPDMGASATAVVQDPYEPGMYDLTGDRVAFTRTERVARRPQECVDCHMPVLTIQGEGEQPLYDHHFVGVNVDLPLYAVADEADRPALEMVARRAHDFLAGTIDAEGLEEESYEDTVHGQTARMLRSAGALALQLSAERTETGLAVSLVSTNHRAGHAFPIGPLDLQEMWLTVEVFDAGGALIAAHGQLDARQRVPEEAHRLGGVELDSSGQPLEQHRIWDFGGMRDKRVVPAGESVTDELTVALPEGAQPHRVRARWRFRRANPEFTAWVYSEERPFPVHDLAEAELTLP